jgi:hypothetical protein
VINASTQGTRVVLVALQFYFVAHDWATEAFVMACDALRTCCADACLVACLGGTTCKPTNLCLLLGSLKCRLVSAVQP